MDMLGELLLPKVFAALHQLILPCLCVWRRTDLGTEQLKTR